MSDDDVSAIAEVIETAHEELLDDAAATSYRQPQIPDPQAQLLLLFLRIKEYTNGLAREEKYTKKEPS